MTRRSKVAREEVIAVLLDFERRGLVHRTGNDKHGYPIFEFNTLEAATEFSKHSVWEKDKASYSDSELKILSHTRGEKK